jgi:hypothetical protein
MISIFHDQLEQRMDLKEVQIYWQKKYPKVHVTLWENEEGSEFYGVMMGPNESSNLKASTIGELIAQGEIFLRTLRI